MSSILSASSRQRYRKNSSEVGRLVLPVPPTDLANAGGTTAGVVVMDVLASHLSPSMICCSSRVISSIAGGGVAATAGEVPVSSIAGGGVAATAGDVPLSLSVEVDMLDRPAGVAPGPMVDVTVTVELACFVLSYSRASVTVSRTHDIHVSGTSLPGVENQQVTSTVQVAHLVGNVVSAVHHAWSDLKIYCRNGFLGTLRVSALPWSGRRTCAPRRISAWQVPW